MNPREPIRCLASPAVAGLAIEVLDLGHARDRKRFLQLADALHARDRCYIPELWRDRSYSLDPQRNPLLGELETQAFLAHRAGHPVGRLLAFVDRRHDRERGAGTGWFGFFESVDDPDVARALLGRAGRWLEGRGCQEVFGPVQLSMDHSAGLLVEGFDRPPVVGTPYNPAWYEELLLATGLQPARDLLSWRWCLEGAADPRSALADQVQRRPGVSIRPIDMRHLEQELPRWHELHSASRRDRWGATPLPRPVFEAVAYELARVAVDELCLFCEVDGRPVGYAITLLDVNRLLPRSGHLSPLGCLRLGWASRKLSHGRVRCMGVLPELRGQGFEALLLAESGRRARSLGYRELEICWTAEDDHAINQAIREMGVKLDRRFRVFGADLESRYRPRPVDPGRDP